MPICCHMEDNIKTLMKTENIHAVHLCNILILLLSASVLFYFLEKATQTRLTTSSSSSLHTYSFPKNFSLVEALKTYIHILNVL